MPRKAGPAMQAPVAIGRSCLQTRAIHHGAGDYYWAGRQFNFIGHLAPLWRQEPKPAKIESRPPRLWPAKINSILLYFGLCVNSISARGSVAKKCIKIDSRPIQFNFDVFSAYSGLIGRN
jgi:hypothetical protein